MIGHWLALLSSWLPGKIKPDQLRRVVAHLAPSRQGVLGIPWAITRVELPQLLPPPLATALAAAPGQADHLVQLRSHLYRIPVTFTFMFFLKKQPLSGFSGLSIVFLRPCPAAAQTLSELFGPPKDQWSMPGASPRHPETHTLWIGDGFDVVSEMTVYNTGALTFELPRMSLSVK